jgi:hypothetical protein
MVERPCLTGDGEIQVENRYLPVAEGRRWLYLVVTFGENKHTGGEVEEEGEGGRKKRKRDR